MIRGRYNRNSQVKFKTTILKLSYVITVIHTYMGKEWQLFVGHEADAVAIAADRNNEEVIFKTMLHLLTV